MNKKIWSYLIHLGYNMWLEPKVQEGYYEGAPQIRSCRVPKTDNNDIHASRDLRFDRAIWYEIADKAADAGFNMFVIDLGEGIAYESHPEVSCNNAISKYEMAEMLESLKLRGIEPIPKLNFSACHDEWLGQYSHMLCTPVYYKVCANLIHEVCELFSSPRFFHIGMDEEVASWQAHNNYVQERQGDLWWHDFLFYVKQIEQCKARTWIWSDYAWHHEDLFFERMPLDVLQSNWYYRGFDVANLLPVYVKYLEYFKKIAQKGYEQVPTGSNWAVPDNFPLLVDYIKNNIEIDSGKILGFMQTTWHPTILKHAEIHYAALDQGRKAVDL